MTPQYHPVSTRTVPINFGCSAAGAVGAVHVLDLFTLYQPGDSTKGLPSTSSVSASTVILASGSRSDTSPAYSGAAIEPALSPTTTTSDAPGAVAATKSRAAVPLTYPVTSRHDPLPPRGDVRSVRGCVGAGAKHSGDVLARLLGHLQLLIPDVDGRTEEEVAVGTDLRVGELLDAVVTHALGELERRLDGVLGSGSGWRGGHLHPRRRGGLGSDRGIGIGLGVVVGAADQADREQQHDGQRHSRPFAECAARATVCAARHRRVRYSRPAVDRGARPATRGDQR